MEKNIFQSLFTAIRRSLPILLLYPWMIGCSAQNTLRTKDENYFEMMGGAGTSTQTMYEMETVPTCSGGTQVIKAAIGKYDAGFIDAGFKYGHFTANSGLVVEGGGGVVTTISQSTPRDYHPGGGISYTPIDDALQSPYGFMNVGKDYDSYGWRLGLFFSAPLHYSKELLLPIIRYRFGRLDGPRMEFGTMRGATYVSSGSIADIGLADYVKGLKTDIYLGVGYSQEYTNGQMLLQTETHTSKNLAIKADINLGIINNRSSDDPMEFGIGVGFKYRW
jgi:hypothetical protein